MLDFTQDIKEAGLLFEDYGYLINAAPISFGKHIQAASSKTKAHLQNYSAKNLLPNMNIALNHYLSNTVALDIDNYTLFEPICKYLGLNLQNLIYNTMAWQGRENKFKLIYNTHGLTLDLCTLISKDKQVIFELKGAKLPGPVTPTNIYSYFDHAPPSIHATTKQNYKWITKLFYKKDLPELPNKLLDVWQNWEYYKKQFLL